MGIYEAALRSAAVDVLAARGSRGFTHRAVDEQAGLPEGTASRYARTRTALLTLVSRAMFAEDGRATELAVSRVGSDEISPIEVAGLMVEVTTTMLASPTRYLARLELQLEATRIPDLHAVFEQARTAFMTGLAKLLRAMGHPDADGCADMAIAMVDGLLHRQLVMDWPPLTHGQLQAVFEALIDAR